MNTKAVHDIFRMLSADSVAYRCNPPFAGRKSKNLPMAAHQRWGAAMNNRQWGWRVAMTAAHQTPASVEYLRTHAGLGQDCSSQAVPNATSCHN